MKRYLLIFFFLASLTTLKAQLYGNEWINTGLTYYKIKITADGIYRIPSALLSNYSDLSTVPASSFALYHNGREVPLYITASPDSVLGANDYIEFYGEKNKGYIDSLLYDSASYQINPVFSVFTDISVYFLTANTLPNNALLKFEAYNLNSPPPKEEYFLHRSLADFISPVYYEGLYYQSGFDEVYKSTYDIGEGYALAPHFGSSPQPFTLFTPFVYSQGPNSKVTTYFANNSKVNGQNHRVQIKLNSSEIFIQPPPPTTSGFQLNKPEINIAATQLVSGNNTISFVDLGTSQSFKANIVGFIQVEYPRQFNFGGESTFYFQLKADAQNKKYFEVTNFNANGTKPLLYDLTNKKIYRSNDPIGTSPIKFQIPPSLTDREMYLRSDDNSTLTEITEMTPALFVNYDDPSLQSKYYIITHNSLRNDGSGNDPVEEYRALRANKPEYSNAQIADIETLYDQFGYGIRKSPLAIRNFINYAKAAFNLEYVFIIGKGRESYKMRFDPASYDQCLVPTFGYPGSDNLLSAKRRNLAAQVAVGRLAAENATTVRDYLDKMIKYEDQQDNYTNTEPIVSREWQKKLLHFSGGSSRTEQTNFSNFVRQYGAIATDTSWGADVSYFSKKTTEPIDESQAEIIRRKINAGVSWMTLFGHSSTNAFDISIDEPENYTNSPKFPIILSNGCFSGYIHDVRPGYSEKFVFAKDKAAIAFMATSHISVISGLHGYSTALYKNMCQENYVQSLGKCVQGTFNDIVCCTTDPGSVGIAEEMNLHGDPGLMINQYPKPDYAIEASSVYFNPAIVNPGVDSFEVNVIVTNLGRAIDTTITISLRREVFDLNAVAVNYNYSKTMSAPYYKDTISFKVPVNISTLGYGQNNFYVLADANKEIDEMAECNNGAEAGCANTPTQTTYILNDDIIPIYPYEFAIVAKKGVTLKASTVNPFAPLRSYRIQIDTSELFANPLAQTVITQTGGVVHWKTDTALYNSVLHPIKDSTVYYWRVKKEGASDSTYHYSSFIYIHNEYEGWNQSHYFQYEKDDYLYTYLDNDRVFKFPTTEKNIRVRTGTADAVNSLAQCGTTVSQFELGWYLNNANMHLYRFGNCGGQQAYYWGGITLGVINNVTGLPWVSKNYDGNNYGDQFGQWHCSGYGDQYGFDFYTLGSAWGNAIANFINTVPNDYFIVLYSVNPSLSSATQWDPVLVEALRSIGFPNVDDFKNGTKDGPFVYFTQKGNSSQNFFANTPGACSTLDTTFDFTANWYQGQFTSPKIGPAVEWHSAHWLNKSLEHPVNTDRDTLDIIGIKESGVDTLLISTINKNILSLNSNFSAIEYPYLKLRLRTRDDSLGTPTQLQYWRVLYKKPPEAAINPAAHFVLNDTIEVGRTLHLEIGLENVTDVPMDSMLTKYTIRDAASGTANYYIRYDTLGGLDTMHLIFDRPIDGGNYVGLNKIIIEANPDNDQIEQYHFNNIAEINFTATGDKINPLLDVTFDNQHIMNGDIVSAKPNILITLKDENKYLALDTSALIDVYLKYPGENTPRKIEYDNTILTFYPADAANLAVSNKAHVEFKPGKLDDGKYDLLIKDRDRSGNNSSTDDSKFSGNINLDYQISFEVINKPMITNVLNYPNPFTTATKFVFTITGTELPDFLKIQIMTIKGTVVKEIMKEELGDLHIGTNITQYTWDGRDQYGDRLANGVYFYHVSARLDDKRMDHMSKSYDKYFKKGFGKLVIVR